MKYLDFLWIMSSGEICYGPSRTLEVVLRMKSVGGPKVRPTPNSQRKYEYKTSFIRKIKYIP
jgi:hypothetical protein